MDMMPVAGNRNGGKHQWRRAGGVFSSQPPLLWPGAGLTHLLGAATDTAGSRSAVLAFCAYASRERGGKVWKPDPTPGTRVMLLTQALCTYVSWKTADNIKDSVRLECSPPRDVEVPTALLFAARGQRRSAPVRTGGVSEPPRSPASAIATNRRAAAREVSAISSGQRRRGPSPGVCCLA